MATEVKKKRSLEEFFSDSFSPGAERKEYVTTETPEGKVVTKSATSTAVVDPKTNNAKVDSGAINVDGVLEEKAPEPAPVVEAPKPQGPYKPLDAQDPSHIQPTLKQTIFGQPQEDSSAWERAMIGATPLLVGLLSGNQLEGAQTSSKYFVGEESDRYKRTKDLNQKLAELKLKRETASTNGKDKFNKVEVFNPDSGQTEIWSTINDARSQFLGLKSPDAQKDKFDKVVIESEKFPGRYETWSTRNGQKYQKLGNDFKKEDVVFKESFNPGSGKNEYKMFTKSGDDLGFVGQLPEGAKKYGMSLEERMALKKYEKDLKADEIKFKQERDLNKDREGVKTTKDTRDIAAAHSKIMSSSFGKDPVQDISTVIGLFKMLDPGSVVRESELALGISAKSYEDWMNNAPELLMKNGYLTPKQRGNIRKLADKMYNDQLKIQESSVDSTMKERAKNYGLNPDYVAPPIRTPYKPESKQMPLKVTQGGVEYTWNAEKGEYE